MSENSVVIKGVNIDPARGVDIFTLPESVRSIAKNYDTVYEDGYLSSEELRNVIWESKRDKSISFFFKTLSDDPRSRFNRQLDNLKYIISRDGQLTPYQMVSANDRLDKLDKILSGIKGQTDDFQMERFVSSAQKEMDRIKDDIKWEIPFTGSNIILKQTYRATYKYPSSIYVPKVRPPIGHMRGEPFPITVEQAVTVNRVQFDAIKELFEKVGIDSRERLESYNWYAKENMIACS